MKIIVSHDVDHLFLTDHLLDTFLPGLLLKSFKEYYNGDLSFKRLWDRFTKMQLNQIKELHTFNKSKQVSETFFFGMRNALNLSYHFEKAEPFIQYLLNENVPIGLHGIAYNDKNQLQIEMERLTKLLGGKKISGIRNHYLRQSSNTKSIMQELSFAFDSTDYELKAPFKIKKMWEFPISIMDVSIIGLGKKKSADIKKKTLSIIASAEEKKLPFFTVNFHDIYFADTYPFHKEWYQWLIGYFKEKNYEFVNFNQAITELEQTKQDTFQVS